MADPHLDRLQKIFPNLQPGTFAITSKDADDYNCIAWAAGDTQRWWWPIDAQHAYWPKGHPKRVTLENFINTFRKELGYRPCKDGSLQRGYEKLAIYVDSHGLPTHMARQLSNGVWSSKLGELEDIAHVSLHGIEQPDYGSPQCFLRRHPPGYGKERLVSLFRPRS